MTIVESIEQLESIYGLPGESSTVKVTRGLTADYRAFVEASPFLAMATSGPEGIDCSPRGDLNGVACIGDDNTLHIPDRRGNNRVDSLRNIVRDPRIALLFFLPGCENTLRVNGNASVCINQQMLDSYAVDGKPPRSVIIVKIQEVYFQCGRAIVRSELWNPNRFIDPKSLPTAGEILANLSDNRVGGIAYDREWPERARNSLW